MDPRREDMLPDSRTSHVVTPKGATWDAERDAWMVPIYCASCAKVGGWVSQENVTWAFWLCQTCEPKYGAIAGVMLVPDALVWELMRQEQMHHGKQRLLSDGELRNAIETDATPLSNLVTLGRKQLRGG